MTKYRNVVITGGISIMNKNNQFGNYFLDYNSKNCKFENAEEIFQNILKEKELTDKKIKELVLEKPHNVSAEFSMLKGLENEGLLDDFISVSIIHSETVEGKFSALMNKKIIESTYGAEVSLKNVSDVDVSDPVKMNSSLGYFMKVVTEELLKGSKETTFFAPVGGYKYMTYLGYVAGSLFGCHSGYMYENAQKLLIIPPIPVEINFSSIIKNMGFIKRLLNEKMIESDSLNEEEQQLVDEVPYFFEKLYSDQKLLIAANAFAQFIFKDCTEGSLKINEDVKKKINKYPSDKIFVYVQIFNLLRKIKLYSNDYKRYAALVQELKHNKEWGIEKPNIYKGASNGKNVFRCAYHFSRDEQILYIYEIWLSHDEYEKDCDLIKKSKKSFNMNKSEMFDLGHNS
ncbi:LOW QUALITY PROTEIN: CRISPR-associated protein, APE2256 family [Caldicellulosiruptor acetigenus 6A]|uniref:CRISPR-associated protein, APE2256 family n=1 Tax=Caldicellulosiruptor acetigenus 6A TaxID=632516 RepID=G2PYK6_9FIRM|nr:LOW QUALITY PROTEIN: CRISPR-associated protein, APE2256 family [Caldicellulosiruptor acetigenus 6A]